MIKTILQFCLLLLLSTQLISQDTLRVMTYNLLNYGNITTYCTTSNNSFLDKEQPLKRVVEYVNPDIFGVVELGSNSFVQQRLLDSVMNANQPGKYKMATYMNQSGSDLISMIYYNSEKMALHSQFSINQEVRDIVLYRLYYRSPDLATTADTAFLNCIVAHLKAGSTSADQQSRATMTSNAMQWIENHGGTGNYLFMGDFNVQSSSEQSYQNLTNYANSSLRFKDPINKTGTWNNNSSMAAYHTQSTHTSSNGCASTGGMDDRFDFILASQKVMDGTDHYRYISGSYKVIGNDGNHYNQAINSGGNSSAPASIISDLYQLSDHLPIILDLEVNQQGAGLKDFSPIGDISVVNPFQNELVIFFNNLKYNDITISIFSVEGKLVWSRENVISSEKQQFRIETTNFQSGIYILRIMTKDGLTQNYKLIKTSGL